jgi:radical SAM superfamily enzyme YgiQ (UPF0313 family)
MSKIFFINPPAPQKNMVVIRDLDRSGRQSMEKTIWPQTSLAYLATIVKDSFEVKVIDCIAEKIYWNEFEEIIKKEKPKYILTNVISSTLTNDLRVAEIGQRIGAVTIAVGPHVTALPKESLRNFPALDYLILGEAEETLKELVNFLEVDKDRDRLENIRGIAFRQNKDIVVTKRRPLIKNLDNLPIPLHQLLPIDKYNLPFIGKGYTFVTTSRGCPYQCIFCRSPIIWHRIVRSRSVKSILKELELLKKLKIKNFLVHSDVFTVNKEIAIELCQAMINQGLKFKWICNSRVDTVDKELLSWMKKAGCWMINYGIESGSQKVLDQAKKGITLSQIKKAVYLTKEVGIKVWGYFMIGLPGENQATVRKTIKLAKELPLDLANFAVAAPYPGTEFYELVKRNGWLVSANWEDFDQNYSPIVNYPQMSNQEICRAMKKAYLVWYLRPSAICKLISGIKNWNDFKAILQIAFSHGQWIVSKS